MSIKLKKQQGNVLTEYGLYLLLAAIVLAALYFAFAQNTSAQDTNQVVSDLIKLSGNVKKDMKGQYSAVNNTKLSTSGYFKPYASLSDASGTVTINSLGATLVASPGNVNATNDSTQYVISNLNDTACKDLASGVVGQAAKLLINSTVVKKPSQPADLTLGTCTGDANSVTYMVL